MSDTRITRVMEAVRSEVDRTKILKTACAVYPKWIHRATLHRVLKHEQRDLTYRELDLHVHYLEEKQLLKIETINSEEPVRWRIRITAKGIDFLEGRFEEPGLASPDTDG